MGYFNNFAITQNSFGHDLDCNHFFSSSTGMNDIALMTSFPKEIHLAHSIMTCKFYISLLDSGVNIVFVYKFYLISLMLLLSN